MGTFRRSWTRKATLVVLGDLGRSPRMQYHALSFLRHGFSVDIVAYMETSPLPSLTSHPKVRIFPIPQPWRPAHGFSRWIFLLWAPFKVILQILQLLWILLFQSHSSGYLLIQNPPAIPTLLVAKMASAWRGSRLIIDWHNFGYTILAMNLGEKSPVVRFAAWYERVFGRRAYAHLCVTRAMALWLRENWELQGHVVVLHDHAPDHFKPLDPRGRHELLGRLCLEDDLDRLSPLSQPFSSLYTIPSGCTLTTIREGGEGEEVKEREERPALLLSSTSWTADEDFGMLLSALEGYDKEASQAPASKHLPFLVMIITGKGPMKEAYEERIRRVRWERVRITTVWLEADDYPRLLGSVDLGISLHTSSSGLDLPMKVVDMFGAGLPVCALGFSCLPELLRDGKDGLVFGQATELTEQLCKLFYDWPKHSKTLDGMRGEVQERFGARRWDENWDTTILPLIMRREKGDKCLKRGER
ncbi:MAG: hypothetical protein DHS80DRAFT_27900 [Piptocephalis tieghemiana]|nr:MAG: hypothetical protein DHS80DRAFT_27900 [Piptocephalis tieghemiana]